MSNRSALLVMLVSALAFVAATAWGVWFAFPEPDASPAQAVALRLHANLSGALMLLSILVFAAASMLLIWRWLRRRTRSFADARPG